MTGEAAFIEALRRIATDPAARGLADDAAVLEIGGEAIVLTHDMMTEGMHFLPGQKAADIAYKLVAVNLSDLAAKGARPLGVLLGYTLGGDDEAFVRGIEDALAEFSVPLLGGDTVAGVSARTHGLTAIGRATHRPVPSRAGARSGDAIYLTGPVGAALAGYEKAKLGETDGAAAKAYLRPVPLIEKGIALAPHVHAMMDVSDGLLLDSWRMARASGATFALDTQAVPIALEAERRADALRWGDDYQLLFTAPPDAELPLAAHRVGEVLEGSEDALLIDGAPAGPPEKLGYLHGS